MKKTIPFVILVILAVALAGCVEEKPTKVEENPTTSVTQTPTTELKLKIGETAKTSRLEVTVKEVFKAKVIGGEYENYWAKDSRIFVFVVVSMRNIDPKSKAWYVGPEDFAVSDENGRRYDVQYLSIEDYLEGGDLNPNEYREGLIAFEVPEHVKKIKIKYDFGDLFRAKLATWEVDMSKIPIKEPRVKILGGKVKYEESIFGYEVEKVTIEVKNEGELPIYLGDIEVKYGAEDWKTLGYAGKLLRPGEKKTIEETEFAILDSKPAVVKVRFVDDDHVIAEGTI